MSKTTKYSVLMALLVAVGCAAPTSDPAQPFLEAGLPTVGADGLDVEADGSEADYTPASFPPANADLFPFDFDTEPGASWPEGVPKPGLDGIPTIHEVAGGNGYFSPIGGATVCATTPDQGYEAATMVTLYGSHQDVEARMVLTHFPSGRTGEIVHNAIDSHGNPVRDYGDGVDGSFWVLPEMELPIGPYAVVFVNPNGAVSNTATFAVVDCGK